MKKVLGIIAVVVLVLAGIVTWFFGPVLGAGLLGRPIFVVATPQRYAHFAFDVAQMQGLYADSEEFANVLAEAKEEVKGVDSIEQTHPIIERVLKAAGGKHSGVIPPERNTPATTEDTTLPSVSKDGDIVIATVPGVARGPVAQQYADTLAKGLADNVAGACGVIVDLRGNTGGDMGPMLAGVSSLLPDGVVLTFKGRASSDVTVSGGSVQGGGSPITVASQSKFTGPIAVLFDGHTGSSGEATLLSFRGLDNVRTFGQPSAGYASANTVFDMPDGAGIMVTTAKDVARTGEEFAEDPIEPDERSDQPEAHARDWLHQECAK
ncbi:MAG: S41 family peptidase [Corynebacterium sp.]|uniref:S41 family peptidase n=1 Tax=Corynebacterium sp. TaxID=1720 RepID=UPI0026DBC53A|nr:S41 family peptidase [Corynebacterium sp.]MDO5097477.1 S41 family peptidase [Corynebacterium sp.]